MCKPCNFGFKSVNALAVQRTAVEMSLFLGKVKQHIRLVVENNKRYIFLSYLINKGGIFGTLAFTVQYNHGNVRLVQHLVAFLHA